MVVLEEENFSIFLLGLTMSKTLLLKSTSFLSIYIMDDVDCRFYSVLSLASFRPIEIAAKCLIRITDSKHMANSIYEFVYFSFQFFFFERYRELLSGGKPSTPLVDICFIFFIVSPRCH